ncbi:MAG: ATP-binding protein [Phycisphaerae bacterium]|jgi:PAS domain S-box-containing protein
MSKVDSANSDAPLLEHLGVAVIATDLSLDIQMWNAAAARTFGAAADRMQGTPILQIIPQERRSTAAAMLKRAIETGETIQLEFQHRDAQGGRRELAATIAPVLSPAGERTGASMCVRDITKRIALQEEVLEGRKMGALGEMAGAIAHHFNNILGGIVTSIDFARESGSEIVKDHVLAQTVKALQRATTLVNGLAAFAEGDRRAEDLGDLTEVINVVATEVERRLSDQGIDFFLNLPKLPVIPVPRVQVTTILRNIVQNAVEAMPDGGRLQIDVDRQDSHTAITVSDTGCGLDEGAQARVFEPFWTTKGDLGIDAGHPTGLGLAIAHGLVQMLGGTIGLTSEVGKGSAFRVTLPTSCAE